MDRQQKLRLGWVELYKEVQDAGIVCRRCGISRPTLRKWLRRYKERGIEGLSGESCKPHNSPAVKVFAQQESIILSLKKERKLGVRRIQSELKRQHSISLSLATYQEILVGNAKAC